MNPIHILRLSLPLATAATVIASVLAAPQLAARPGAAPEPRLEAPRGRTPSRLVVAQATTGSQPTLLGQYGEWGAYTGNSGGRKVCFVLSKPVSSETDPPNRPRDPIYLFVSSRPAENVRNEVSIIIGYPFKPNSEAVVEIGPAKFEMYTQNDGAWIKNAAEEGRLVDAMRKGADLVVRGLSSRGTRTTDRFSLKGISQALDRVAQECR